MLLLISGLGDENTKLEFGQIYEKNYRTMYYVALKILKNQRRSGGCRSRCICKTRREI